MSERVHFRVNCRDPNGIELTWKITDTLEAAINYLNNLEPRLRDRCEWLVYETTIGASGRIVHRVDRKTH
jgi:hypothetical protein